MNFLALNDDVKFIIASHLASDLKMRSLLSKNHGIQKKLGRNFIKCLLREDGMGLVRT